MTDRFKARDVNRVIYKPTEDMESDYLTNALQGKAFHTHRKTLMGLDGINERMFYEKNTRNMKIISSDIGSIISPIHNK